MDRRERFEDPNVALLVAMRGMRADIWTAMPGILQSFDATARTASVQIAIQALQLMQDGTEQAVTISILEDCPVVFQQGGGFEMTFPLAEGNEGLVVLASRCIDGWWQSGGVQPQAELRMHDLSDGFFLPGVYSQPRKPAVAASATEAQIRSLDGLSKISLGATAARMSMAGGATSLTVDAATGRVSVVAVSGLWVNGVLVVVP